jgi:hypothetical protein
VVVAVAYVRYDSAENAKAAMEGLDGVCLQDAKLKVMVADERGPRPPVGGSSGGVAVGGASASGGYAAICDQTPLHHHHHHPRDTVGEGLRESPTTDPDNYPPRSRLFIVCPRNADPVKIQVRCERRGGGRREAPSPLHSTLIVHTLILYSVHPFAIVVFE